MVFVIVGRTWSDFVIIEDNFLLPWIQVSTETQLNSAEADEKWSIALNTMKWYWFKSIDIFPVESNYQQISSDLSADDGIICIENSSLDPSHTRCWTIKLTLLEFDVIFLHLTFLHICFYLSSMMSDAIILIFSYVLRVIGLSCSFEWFSCYLWA